MTTTLNLGYLITALADTGQPLPNTVQPKLWQEEAQTMVQGEGSNSLGATVSAFFEVFEVIRLPASVLRASL